MRYQCGLSPWVTPVFQVMSEEEEEQDEKVEREEEKEEFLIK